jgi:hypothetical protein
VSATLSIDLDPGPIERTGADVVIVTFFQEDRPLRGSAGRADWRICGRLSQLLAAGEVEGLRGEALLMPTRGGLRAPLLVAVGLGRRKEFRSDDWEATARDAVERGLNLGAAVLALPMPDLGRNPSDLKVLQRVEAVVAGAARALSSLSSPMRSGAEMKLRLVAPRDQAERVRKALRTARPRGIPSSVAVRLPAAVAPRPDTSRPDRGPGSHPTAAS